MSQEDETIEPYIQSFRDNSSEIICEQCGAGTGVWGLPWFQFKQHVLCDECSGKLSPSLCYICEGTGRVYLPSFSQAVASADLKSGNAHMHPYPDKIYWLSCACICECGHKFRIRTVDDESGNVIFESHVDNKSTQTFLERGYSEDEVKSFRAVQEEINEKIKEQA